MSYKKLKILFVCTGNVFRSMIAEYCLKDFLNEHHIKNIIVSSAGTKAKKEQPYPATIRELKRIGIPMRGRRRKKLTRAMIMKYNFIIAMAREHQIFMRRKFDLDVPLFNEIALGKKTSILDIDKKVKNYSKNQKGIDEYCIKIVDYIHELTPKLFNGIVLR